MHNERTDCPPWLVYLDPMMSVVLFNSHDHQFVDSIANRIIEFTPKGLIDRYMEFDDYMSDPAIKALRMEMYGSKNAVAL